MNEQISIGRPPGVATQARRAVGLLRHVRDGRGGSIASIAARLGVTGRTIRRDMEALRDGGATVGVDQETGRVVAELTHEDGREASLQPVTQCGRCVLALGILLKGPTRIRPLASKLGVTPRTAWRYLRALQEAGVPLEQVRGGWAARGLGASGEK